MFTRPNEALFVSLFVFVEHLQMQPLVTIYL